MAAGRVGMVTYMAHPIPTSNIIREHLTRIAAGKKRELLLGLFGKHPAWEDHIPSYLRPPELETVDRLLDSGVVGNIDNRWGLNLEYFIAARKSLVVGGIFPCIDGSIERRAQKPLIIAAYSSGLPRDYVFEQVLPRLRGFHRTVIPRVKQEEVESHPLYGWVLKTNPQVRCFPLNRKEYGTVAITQEEVCKAHAELQAEFNNMIRSLPEEVFYTGVEQKTLEQFFNRSDWDPNRAKLEHVLADLWENARLAGVTPGRGVRVPLGIQTLDTDIKIWAALLDKIIGEEYGYTIIVAPEDSWIGLFSGSEISVPQVRTIKAPIATWPYFVQAGKNQTPDCRAAVIQAITATAPFLAAEYNSGDVRCTYVKEEVIIDSASDKKVNKAGIDGGVIPANAIKDVMENNGEVDQPQPKSNIIYQPTSEPLAAVGKGVPQLHKIGVAGNQGVIDNTHTHIESSSAIHSRLQQVNAPSRRILSIKDLFCILDKNTRPNIIIKILSIILFGLAVLFVCLPGYKRPELQAKIKRTSGETDSNSTQFAAKVQMPGINKGKVDGRPNLPPAIRVNTTNIMLQAGGSTNILVLLEDEDTPVDSVVLSEVSVDMGGLHIRTNQILQNQWRITLTADKTIGNQRAIMRLGASDGQTNTLDKYYITVVKPPVDLVAGSQQVIAYPGYRHSLILQGMGDPDVPLKYRILSLPKHGKVAPVEGIMNNGAAKLEYLTSPGPSMDELTFVVYQGDKTSAIGNVAIQITNIMPLKISWPGSAKIALLVGQSRNFDIQITKAPIVKNVEWQVESKPKGMVRAAVETKEQAALLDLEALPGSGGHTVELTIKVLGDGGACGDVCKILLVVQNTNSLPMTSSLVKEKVFRINTENGIQVEFEMVWVAGLPGGGDWDESHRGGGWVGKYEVNQTQYEAYTSSRNMTNPSSAGREFFKEINKSWSGKLPVENVTFNEAVSFCDFLNQATDNGRERKGWVFRLPTVEQWKHMFNTAYPQYQQGKFIASTNHVLSVFIQAETMHKHPLETGELRDHNPLGIQDLIGNVWEWCVANETNAVCYGGGFDTVNANVIPFSTRSTSRTHRLKNVGFRVLIVPAQRNSS
ncbi:MAG: SUMF1/EgtB/PvdO family nonheme iron enzyme [Verrucomicrobiae bacterium]|nr:SUMF1/EgtB/PvdO family nonheme iron enzyme [Verrucomicrobiae bacterium]